MSERGYFEKRTAIPGYTFVLIVIAINYVPLLEILKTQQVPEVFGALLGFLALLGGSAIGFLVSQIWWWRWQKTGAQYYDWRDRSKLSRPIDALIKKYSLIKGRAIADMKKVLAVYGYVVHFEMEKKGMKEVVRYTTRRWDLYHLHSSVRVTLFVAFLLGILSRFLFEIMDGRFKFSFLRNDFQWTSAIPELVVLFLAFFAVIALHRLLEHAQDWIAPQYDALSCAVVNGSEISEERLRMVFPSEYFNHPKAVTKNEYICEVVSDSKKAKKLIENGFEYITTFKEKMFLKKRK